MKKLVDKWPILVIILAVLAFSFPYWAKNLMPFPSSYLVTTFPPWQYFYGMPVKNNAMPDVVTQMYPWKHLVIESWKRGQVPLWNPYNFSGSPFLANYQSAVFHPFNWLFFLFPEVDAWSLMILFQPLLAGLFTYLFARSINLSKSAALLSSVGFMFCGFMTTWMAYGTLSYALLWLPLILYGIEKNFKKANPFSCFLISAGIVASLFSGHFQTSLYVVGGSLAYFVFKVFTEKKKVAGILSFLAVAFGIGMAALQLLPTYELYKLSVRGVTNEVSEIIPWKYLVTLIAPDFYGNQVTRNNWLGNYAEMLPFFGVIPLILAIYLLFGKKNRYAWFFALLGIGGLLTALPTPLLTLLEKSNIPVLSNSAVSRIVGFFSFCSSILAGFGLETLRKDFKSRSFIKIFSPIVAVLLIVALIWAILLVQKPFTVEHLATAKRNFILPTGLALSFFLVVIASWLSKRLVVFLTFFLIVLTFFDLFRFAKKWMPFDPKVYAYPSVEVLDYLGQTTPPNRVFGYFGMEMVNWGKIQGFDGYDPLYINRYGEFLMSSGNGVIRAPWIRGVGLDKRGKNTIPILNLLGGKYLLHALADGRFDWAFPYWEYPKQFKLSYRDDKYEVYENVDALPRAFLVYDYQVINKPQPIIDELFSSSFNPRSKVILEEEINYQAKAGATGSAQIVNYSPNRIQISSQTSDDGILVLSDIYYPGWKVTVDGQETPYYRANYTLRALKVPAGEHQIVFNYFPPSFKIALLVSSLSLLGLIISITIVVKKR